MRTIAFPALAATVAGTLAFAAAPQQAGQSAGYGYGQSSGGAGGGDPNAVPPGVGYNNPGGELSRKALQQQALSPEYHLHMNGPNAAAGVGSGGGPPVQGGEMPGYVQSKFVTPYGNAVVMHHYGPGYPPPMGAGGGPNDGNSSNLMASGTVAGNPGLVNWGLTPAQTREEINNGVWFGGAASGSGNPVPYVGSFND